MITDDDRAGVAAFLHDPEVVVHEATSRTDRDRIRREVEGRRWATKHGIPTAETVAVGPDDAWIVSRRLVDRPGESLPYLEAALEASFRIQRAPAPEMQLSSDAWSAPRSAAVGNAVRLAAAGVMPWEFVRTRATAEAVPSTVTIHNDFHRNNVLRAADDAVAVIDWELLSPGPIHRDFLLLLVGVRDDALARQGWEMLRAATPRAEHAALAQQLPWLALRCYAIEICEADYRRPTELAHHRRRWGQARAWAAEVLN